MQITTMDQEVGVAIGIRHMRVQWRRGNILSVLPSLQINGTRPCRELGNLGNIAVSVMLQMDQSITTELLRTGSYTPRCFSNLTEFGGT